MPRNFQTLVNIDQSSSWKQKRKRKKKYDTRKILQCILQVFARFLQKFIRTNVLKTVTVGKQIVFTWRHGSHFVGKPKQRNGGQINPRELNSIFYANVFWLSKAIWSLMTWVKTTYWVYPRDVRVERNGGLLVYHCNNPPGILILVKALFLLKKIAFCFAWVKTLFWSSLSICLVDLTAWCRNVVCARVRIEKLTSNNNNDEDDFKDDDDEYDDDNPWNIVLPVTSIVKLQVAMFPDWSMAVYVTM